MLLIKATHKKFVNVYLNAENPPKRAPLAIPTQNPIPKPIFIRSKQLGPWPCEYIFDGTAGMFIDAQLA